MEYIFDFSEGRALIYGEEIILKHVNEHYCNVIKDD